MQKTFSTPNPVSLYVEIGSGGVTLHTDDTAETTVDVNGKNADGVVVEQRGDEIVVVARQSRGGFFGSGNDLDVHVSLPHSSRLTTKLGSADLRVMGRIGQSMVRSGSGDVMVETAGDSLQVKSGSGDLQVREALNDVALSTASGDLLIDRMHRGQLAAKNVSGDIRVGIPAGIPVWTDITSMTGSVRSNLEGAGEPEEGQDYIELRAKTVSGDVYLEQL
jgi:hypothetical protein